MMQNNSAKGVLSFEERLIYRLRAKYGMRGFLPFKMSKFEEYDLYMRNRDFLIGENIISFTDTDGTLLALKPDVTLSIIKNAKDAPGVKEKLYYSENVYRTQGSSHKFKEIMQIGLECIGDIDSYDVCESIWLAAESLSEICDDFVLDVSHMGVVAPLLDAAEIGERERTELLGYIAGKNMHEAAALLKKCDTPPELSEKIIELMSVRVPLSEAAERLGDIAKAEMGEAAVAEISALADSLKDSPFAEKIYFDASLMNDMNYYNGIVFRGFISGVSEGVLSGGRYDALMKRMGKTSSGVGFAIYLDLLEGHFGEAESFDVDVLLIYDEKIDTGAVMARVRALTEEGFSVSAQRAVPEGVRYARIERMEG